LARVGPAERVADAPPVAQTSAQQPQEWAALESLFNLSAQFTSTSPARRAYPLQPSGLAVFGICGGVGASTIVSALGKIWAKAMKRVLLVDASSCSLLPLFFGAQLPCSGIATFISSGPVREGSIYVACGKMDEPVRALLSEVDRFYVDGGLFRLKEEQLLQNAAGVSLAVLVPDTRCVVELNRLEREGIDIPYLLLNQFDAAQPLHREIQYRLAKQFNQRLIPITIGLDPEVGVALANGTTIIDYAPSSAITQDIYNVNEWLAANFATLPKSELSLAGQQS
jgi:cellulose biosynthesis protein BcsQ